MKDGSDNEGRATVESVSARSTEKFRPILDPYASACTCSIRDDSLPHLQKWGGQAIPTAPLLIALLYKVLFSSSVTKP